MGLKFTKLKTGTFAKERDFTKMQFGEFRDVECEYHGGGACKESHCEEGWHSNVPMPKGGYVFNYVGAWGHDGSGGFEFARRILIHFTNGDTCFAIEYCGHFVQEVVVPVPDSGGTIAASSIIDWIEERQKKKLKPGEFKDVVVEPSELARPRHRSSNIKIVKRVRDEELWDISGHGPVTFANSVLLHFTNDDQAFASMFDVKFRDYFLNRYASDEGFIIPAKEILDWIDRQRARPRDEKFSWTLVKPFVTAAEFDSMNHGDVHAKIEELLSRDCERGVFFTRFGFVGLWPSSKQFLRSNLRDLEGKFFEWGYVGQGPLEGSKIVLEYFAGEEFSNEYSMRFMKEVISKIPFDGGVLETAAVRKWINEQKKAAASSLKQEVNNVL